jgi:hypothetical protein
MAKHDGKVQGVALNGPQAMALGLGMAAAEAAGDFARLGGYVATGDDWQRVTRAITDAALAMVLLVEDWEATTDEQAEGAARDLGVRAVRELLGPPPAAN